MHWPSSLYATGLHRIESIFFQQCWDAVSLKADRTTAQSGDHDCTQLIVVRPCRAARPQTIDLRAVVSARNEANSNLLLMFFPVSFNFKLYMYIKIGWTIIAKVIATDHGYGLRK